MPVAHGIGPTIEADPETLGSVTDTDSTTRQIATDTSAPRLSLPSPDRVQSPAPEPRGRRIVRQKIDLDNSVTFAAKDSVILIGRDSAFMYGTGNVKYGDIQLDAAQIEMNLNDNTVYAVGTPDTAGVMQGRPVFSEGGTDYEANTMRYNFKSRKGIIHDVVTQQGEGYLHSGLTKKADDETYYFENGKYTTCDDRDCPHFYFQITKGKMRPGKDVGLVSGFSSPAPQAEPHAPEGVPFSASAQR